MENRTRALLTKALLFQRCYRLNLKRKWEEAVRSAQGRWGVIPEHSTVYWGGRGERWSQSCPLRREGVRFGPKAVYKGKVRKRKRQEDCAIQSPPVFQVKVTRLWQWSRGAKEERSLEHELLTTHSSQFGTNQQWWPCLTQTDCCFW